MTLKLENKIKLKYDRKIKISEYQSIYTTNSHNKELMYSDFVNNLMIPKVTNEKGSAGCFIAGFVDGIRNKKNTKTRSMLTLDIDNELTFDGQRAAIWLRNNIANYFKFSYVMYSTHNSTKENPRYRLIIPLKKDVNPNESIMICKYITNYILRINVDSSSFNFSQVMFYPTCKNIENYEFYFNDH